MSPPDDDRDVAASIMTECMKEAMARPESPPLRGAEILRIAEEMQRHPGDARGRASVFSRLYPGFVEQCPALFQKACRPDLDMNMLRFMVSTMETHGDGASEIVGERLAERFVTAPSRRRGGE